MLTAAIGKLVLVGLVSGLNWTITHKGKRFLNIHQDPAHVKRSCREENSISVPISFSVIYCNLLNSADRDVEVSVTVYMSAWGQKGEWHS